MRPTSYNTLHYRSIIKRYEAYILQHPTTDTTDPSSEGMRHRLQQKSFFFGIGVETGSALNCLALEKRETELVQQLEVCEAVTVCDKRHIRQLEADLAGLMERSRLREVQMRVAKNMADSSADSSSQVAYQ
jgi:hypothetical protein